MRYSHCIFDLYGTLVDIRTDEHASRLWTEMAEVYCGNGAGYRPEELRDAYFRLVAGMEGETPGERDAHEAHPEIKLELVFQRLYREKGVDTGLGLAVRTGMEFRRRSTQYLRLYDGAGELLRGLRAGGCGVWLLSNAQAIFTWWELEQLGLDVLFDGIYLSSDYGCKKPDPRFFRVLLGEQGISPDSAVMIGNDGVCDIQGAAAVGLSTVYIRSNLSPAEPMPQADCMLEAMDLRRVGRFLGLPQEEE